MKVAVDQVDQGICICFFNRKLLLSRTVREADLNGGKLGPLVQRAYMSDCKQVSVRRAWSIAWSNERMALMDSKHKTPHGLWGDRRTKC